MNVLHRGLIQIIYYEICHSDICIVSFGSNISPNYVMPADTHRHVIHKKTYSHIYASLFDAFLTGCISNSVMDVHVLSHYFTITSMTYPECIMHNYPRKGQRYILLLDGGILKGWGSNDSWLLIVCHD